LYAIKYTKDSNLSEEIVQDVFVNIWEKRKFLNIEVSFKSYLYISVRNKCLQHIERKKIIKKHKKYTEKRNDKKVLTPHEKLLYKETSEIFYSVLKTLPERCEQIFKLSRLEGLKYNEIAAKLSVSVKTVEANISKALKIFKHYFPEIN